MSFLVNSAFKKNISWILVGNVLHAILQFGINVLAARILLPAEYGLINYSLSVVSLFLAVSTLGFGGTITKKFAENESEAGKYIWSATVTRACVALPFILICLSAGYLRAPNDSRLQVVMLCQSLNILFSSFDSFIYWFRYKYKASVVAVLRLIAFAFAAIWRLAALVALKSTAFYVLGTAGETAMLGLMLLLVYRKMQFPALRFDTSCLKQMLSISYPFIFSSILMTVYGQTDKIMLEMLLDMESVGYYSVSLTLAGAISIIPSAIIDGFRPEIMREKENNEQVYQKRLRQAYCSVFWICIAYCIFITIFAKGIMLLFYGQSYVDAVSSLSIIVWYTSFSYFGAINNIFMVSEQKYHWVQITTLVGALLNVVLNFLLIPALGIVGAATASLITQIVINTLLLLVIEPLRKAFFMQVMGVLNVDCFAIGKLSKREKQDK